MYGYERDGIKWQSCIYIHIASKNENVRIYHMLQTTSWSGLVDRPWCNFFPTPIFLTKSSYLHFLNNHEWTCNNLHIDNVTYLSFTTKLLDYSTFLKNCWAICGLHKWRMRVHSMEADCHYENRPHPVVPLLPRPHQGSLPRCSWLCSFSLSFLSLCLWEQVLATVTIFASGQVYRLVIVWCLRDSVQKANTSYAIRP